jgi:hypothetical protein
VSSPYRTYNCPIIFSRLHLQSSTRYPYTIHHTKLPTYQTYLPTYTASYPQANMKGMVVPLCTKDLYSYRAELTIFDSSHSRWRLWYPFATAGMDPYALK